MSERSYYLAVAMLRWELCAGRYAEARKRRHGQRSAWRSLRAHVSYMMEAGL